MVGLTPVRRLSVADAVAQELRAAIRAGRYRPGEHLIQAAIADALGVSRTPLRHALAQLATEGLVEESVQGYRVSVPEVRQALEMFEICANIEAHAARLAAQKADGAWCSRLLRAAHNAPLRPSRDPEHEPTEFHDLVAAATGNAALIRLRPVAMSAIDLSFVDTVNLARAPTAAQSRAEHAAIADAIARRDADAAAALTTEHIRAGAKRLAEALTTQPVEAAT
jgi:DNA-binding GntR family transcriptional regulator